MRTLDWQDFAIPLALVFAVAFVFALNTERSASVDRTREPDYAMTVVAKRLPAECRGAAAQTPACDALRADRSVVVRDGSPRETARATMLDHGF